MDMETLGGLFAICACVVPIIMAVVAWKTKPSVNSNIPVITSFLSLLLLIGISVLTPGQSYTMSLPAELPPIGLSFRVDKLSMYFGTIICFIWGLVSVYAKGYFDNDKNSGRFHSASCATLAGVLGVAMAGDMFTLFLFFELMSLAAYVLIIHEQNEESFNAGFKYLLMTIGGSLALFFALITTFQKASTLSFDKGPFGANAGGLLAFTGYLIGFGIKAGVFPLHVWLPDAHPVAPSPASALLSGLMIKTGAFGLIRVIYQFYGTEYLMQTGWNKILLYAGAITIFIGSAVAILQDDIKRRLAYSSVGQIGYILVAISLLNNHALLGGLFHIFGHACSKTLLFMAAGTVIHLSGKRKVEDMAGLGKVFPKTFYAFALASLSMVGIPPLVGFISKWHIAWGALDNSMPWVVVLLLISSFMNGIYYLPIVINAFFKEPIDKSVAKKKEPAIMWMPVMVLALCIFAAGLVFGNIPLSVASQAAGSVLTP